jgi:predicted DNA-binding transcriptional regulator YafY
MNRFDRLTAILIHLQSKKIVVAQEIADRFEVSLRTVYRDIKSLEEAGVPVIGEKGLGYSLMEGYRLPPVMFTEEEVIAFLMAEKILENYADIHNSKLFKSAMYKIRAVLRSAEKTKLEHMDENITVRQKNSEHNFLINDTIPVLLKSISEKRALRVKYAAEGDKATEWEIEPIGIFHEHGAWSVLAFCPVQNIYRPFRTERILSITVTGKGFQQEHPTMKEYFVAAAPSPKSFPAVIDIKADKARYLQDQKFNYGFRSEKILGSHVRMYFDAPCLEAFSRWYITFADFAVIVQPIALKGLLKDRLMAVLKEIS